MAFGFQILNESSAEVVLPAPISRTLGVRKKITIVVDDPQTIENNTELLAMVRNRIIIISQVDVTTISPPPPAPFQLVPGPPGPPGPVGPPGSGAGDAGAYTCPMSVQVLNLVRSSATGQVDKANANAEGTMPVLGIVISKSTTTNCIVQYRGEVTGFVGLIPDTIYYAATTAGSITIVAPTVTGNVVQRIGIARDSTTLVLDIDEFIIL